MISRIRIAEGKNWDTKCGMQKTKMEFGMLNEKSKKADSKSEKWISECEMQNVEIEKWNSEGKK